MLLKNDGAPEYPSTQERVCGNREDDSLLFIKIVVINMSRAKIHNTLVRNGKKCEILDVELHSPSLEAHYQTAAITKCHNESKYRSCHIDAILRTIQDSENVAVRIGKAHQCLGAIDNAFELSASIGCCGCSLQHKCSKVEKHCYKMV